MRELQYAVEGKAANLKTLVCDEPAWSGACHHYQIMHPLAGMLCDIEFQEGPIDAQGNGVNGIQHEDLLAILIDRLEGFQRGPYACEENEAALLLLKTSLETLQRRTRARIARKVEGTHTV